MVFFEIFPWDKNFETGIDIIDEQHKKLVDILNRLAAHLANRSDDIIMNDIFDELASYADYHFKSEEKIWNEYLADDEWSVEHHHTHGSFIDDVIKIKNNEDEKPLDDVVYEIVSFLSKWLAYHILDTDKRLAIAVREIKSGIGLQEAKKFAIDEMNGSMKVIVDTVLSMYETLSTRTLDLMREKSLRKEAEEALKISFEKERKLQEEYLLQQSRMAQMGEMISIIAHQWKQPLNTISLTSAALQMNLVTNKFDFTKEDERKKCISKFNDNLQHIDNLLIGLSNTMDDFRHFYNPNRERSLELIQNPVIKALHIIKESLSFDGIEIDENYNNDTTISMHENEIMQVVLNILKNAQDNFKEKGTINPRITITAQKNEKSSVLKICDNGGGIEKDILESIFKPYFSTKNKESGTGLGLYMSKIIIESHHDGKLYIENINNTQGQVIGACFIIDIIQ